MRLPKKMHKARVKKYARSKRTSPISKKVWNNTPAQDRGAQGVKKKRLGETQVPNA